MKCTSNYKFYYYLCPKSFLSMKVRGLLILLLALSWMSACAQGHSRRVRAADADTVPELVKAYADSLQMRRTEIDSLFAANDSLEGRQLDGRYYRFFVPLTFYHNVTGALLNISGADDAGIQNSALLDVYLHRPDLVGGTQSQIDHAGPVMQPSEEPVNTDIDIIGEVAPKAKAEDVYTPINIYVEKPNFWSFSGDYSL